MDIPTLALPTVPIAGGGRFPVRRIVCVGRNYPDHAREMGSDPARENPFFFSKPADAVVESGTTIAYPALTHDLHHEIELVLALGGGGRDIAQGDALGLVFGHAVGLDLTRRDLQAEAKKAGRPWDMAKGFDQSAPIGAIARGLPADGAELSLGVNGETRQHGCIVGMIWSMAEVIAILSTYVALAPGDLIFTGTPAGVGAIEKGDRLRGTLTGCDPIEITIG